jgi:flagellar biosynthesis protein FlhB
MNDEPAPLSKFRLQEARRLGYSPRSPELTAGVVMLAVAWVGYSSLPSLVASLRNLVAESFQLSTLTELRPEIGNLRAVGLEILRILAASWAAALVVDLLQVGVVWSPITPLPHEERVNPISGIQRLLGWSTWERATLLCLKLTISFLVVGGLVWKGTMQLDSFAEPQSISPHLAWGCGLLGAVGALCVFTGLTDAWRRQNQWRRSLEQSEDERRSGPGH